MKKNCFKLLCIAILIVLLIGSLVACGTVNASVSVGETPASIGDDSQSSGDIPENTAVSAAKYNEGVVLVKTESFDKTMLGTLQYKSVDALYKNSLWHKVVLEENASTQDAVAYLRDLNTFDKVDYDYIMGSDGEVESIDISSNPNSSQQTYLDTHKIKDAWGYLKDNDKTAGGSPDVVVAVIDTGVDYNHVDLRNNIWVNTGEIPGNGIDDDGNGYIDDYYGWNCVGDNNDPMDDNGHGTHVAGIIAAENNSFGTVGVAYNCKVMCIKAGNSSGYFNNSDIAEAIQYAYMNGASVINMSFGGSSISIAVEDALENAYNQCVLVSAAGNDGLCNNLDHSDKHAVGVSYPAALPYVVGVMSTDLTGLFVSPFSNYDDTPYNSIEYEVYACGAQIPSTWPNNKIATLSGTSMAAPMVSGIAALLRSKFSDREVYSTKYLQSQIVNTGSIHPYNATLDDVDYDHSVANVYEALTKVPKPAVSLYDYYIFDNTEYSDKNNGDGIINAGETIRLAIELHNRGGVASNVVATIDTIRNEDASLVDPYFEIINNSINMSDIGTYNVRDCGKLKDDNGFVVGTTLYFEIKVADDCPNDYLASFNVHMKYTNGLDLDDATKYNEDATATISVNNGYVLPSVISEDNYVEDKPKMSLSTSFDAVNNQVILTVILDENSHLGAGDFAVEWDKELFTFAKFEKLFTPSFFNVNDKQISNGILKFSIISMSDITDRQNVIQIVFGVNNPHDPTLGDFVISGSALADSMTNAIVLNFVGCKQSVEGKHVFGEWQTSINPSCTNQGEEQRICSICELIDSRTLAPLGHDFAEEWTIDLAVTCITNGSKSHHCSRCDAVSDVTKIDALGHDEIHHDGKDATCLEYGWYDYVTCSRCDYTTYMENPALGHDFTADWMIDMQPTCTDEGSKSRHCSRCDEITDVTGIAALGHNFGEWTISVNPTYENEGEEQHACSTCGEVENRSIPKLSRGPLVFEDMVKAVNSAKGDAKRDAINRALSYYDSLTEEEKTRAAESYDLLQKEISAYEHEIETESHDRLILIISLSIAATLILAVGVICIVFRKKLFKRKKYKHT